VVIAKSEGDKESPLPSLSYRRGVNLSSPVGEDKGGVI